MSKIWPVTAKSTLEFGFGGGSRVVDLLGKVEPIVAHLNVLTHRDGSAVCWRNAPGHNKGDDARVFEESKPEFTRGRPPASQKDLYFKFKYGSTLFFVRKDKPMLQKSVQTVSER